MHMLHLDAKSGESNTPIIPVTLVASYCQDGKSLYLREKRYS